MSDTSSRGYFITFEGIDGSGKTTQAKLLVSALEALGLEVVLLREPGGTSISEKVRSILLDRQNDEMSETCELLLLEASRAQLVHEVIEPALASGKWVVCDRFYDSTFAYQSGGRGLDAELVRTCNKIGSNGLVPDLTFWLDLDTKVAYARATAEKIDRLEAAGVAFQERVAKGYEDIFEFDNQNQRIQRMDANDAPEILHEAIKLAVSEYAKGLV